MSGFLTYAYRKDFPTPPPWNTLPESPLWNVYRTQVSHHVVREWVKTGDTKMVLDLSCLSLEELPPIPETVEVLRVGVNRLTTLPPLPPNLRTLSCGINCLTSLPSLPDSLENLYLEGNRITALPPLPKRLIELSCRANLITELPDTLPPGLTLLSCGENRITRLPFELPHSLVEIEAAGNDLICVPELSSHQHLSISRRLTTLDLWRNFVETDREWIGRIPVDPRVSKKRITQRCEAIQEELMMKMWHPSRVERLMLAGVDMEDM